MLEAADFWDFLVLQLETEIERIDGE